MFLAEPVPFSWSIHFCCGIFASISLFRVASCWQMVRWCGIWACLPTWASSKVPCFGRNVVVRRMVLEVFFYGCGICFSFPFRLESSLLIGVDRSLCEVVGAATSCTSIEHRHQSHIGLRDLPMHKAPHPSLCYSLARGYGIGRLTHGLPGWPYLDIISSVD